MRIQHVGVGVLLLFISSLAFGQQNTRGNEVRKPPAPVYQAHKDDKKSFLSGIFKKKKDVYNIEPQAVPYKQSWFKRFWTNLFGRKQDRLARKPQYNDPTYFGHKRPPKKRPLGKRKFCKECGIRH
jgi:hypothetical protein